MTRRLVYGGALVPFLAGMYMMLSGAELSFQVTTEKIKHPLTFGLKLLP